MLDIVFGRTGYGKTEYVFNSIKSLVDKGRGDILLITPEQFSLVSEKRLLTDLGESCITKVNNTSFSNLSNDVKSKYGCENYPVLSKGGKAVLMIQAIDSVKDELMLFNRKLDSSDFVNSMISIYDEMKSCNLDSTEILSLSKNIENTALRDKMYDIATIMSSYENIISNKFLDPADELTRLYNQLKDKNYFAGKYVFIDGFNGFVAQEYKILELIIKESDNTLITLCTDSYDSDDKFNLFAYVNNTVKIIEKIATKAGIKINHINLKENYRAKNDELKYLEKNIFDVKSCYAEDVNNIKIYSAKTITDECCEASRQIRKMLRNGCKASSIAVIVRDIDNYRDELSSAFRKYEIPFFNDERQPIVSQPLVVFIKYLLRCILFSLRSDDILSLAKTGLTDIDDKSINDLENYIYLWNINGSKWKNEFVNSPKGFASDITQSDQMLLNSINETRSRLIAPILRFKNEIKNADTQKICEEIYNTLKIYHADDKIREFAVALSSSKKQALAVQQGDVWDIVMKILSQLPVLLPDKISLKDFSNSFSILISAEDIGVLPGGIDNVQFGQADRIRVDNPTAVFIMGANEGEFPKTLSGNGLISDSERRLLLEYDFKLYSYSEILNLQERYFAYMACCAPREKLFISYTGSASKESSPSEAVTGIKDIFTNIKEYNFNSIKDIDLVETRTNAFELMSRRYLHNTTFSSSLKKYFENDDKFNAVKALAESDDMKINNKQLSTSLFGKKMMISASRIEDYYNCSFRYFCKFGLSAMPRNKAEINPMQRGTLIHYVLEMILSTYGSKKLSTMSRNEIIAAVDYFVTQYYENEMGNITDVSVRFKYNFNRLSKLIYSVVIHLSEEFSCSDFEAKAFELKIDNDSPVKPEILKLDDGGTIQIRGSIDRLDSYEYDGEKYIRVVDYKSGNKSFSLSNIINGLNLQMFIYLFSVYEDKQSEYNGLPAGVLYMHSARNVFSFDTKKEASQQLSDTESASMKMKGIVISDKNGEIAYAMEHDLNGKYIPVKVKKSGDLTGQLASLEELGLIHKKINELIVQMGTQLHGGKISRNPIKSSKHNKICEYCDYQDVCANTKMIKNRLAVEISDNDVKALLKKEYGDYATMDNATK